MATMKPSHVIVADDAAELALLKDHLVKLGYPAGEGAHADRSDVNETLTITVAYPEWVLDLGGE